MVGVIFPIVFSIPLYVACWLVGFCFSFLCVFKEVRVTKNPLLAFSLSFYYYWIFSQILWLYCIVLNYAIIFYY